MTAYVIYNVETKEFWDGHDWVYELTNAKLFKKPIPTNDHVKVGKVQINFIESVPTYKYKKD